MCSSRNASFPPESEQQLDGCVVDLVVWGERGRPPVFVEVVLVAALLGVGLRAAGDNSCRWYSRGDDAVNDIVIGDEVESARKLPVAPYCQVLYAQDWVRPIADEFALGCCSAFLCSGRLPYCPPPSANCWANRVSGACFICQPAVQGFVDS